MRQKEAVTQEEDVTYRIWPYYRRKCNEMGIVPLPSIRDMLDKATQALKLERIKIHEEVGPMHSRALFEAITEIKYQKLKVLNFWEAKVGDEGVRAISQYICYNKSSVEMLDLIQNQITELGCEFIGKSLVQNSACLRTLKLDNNSIGSKGLQELVIGLRANPTLQKLSLKNCGIDHIGVIYLQQILANLSTSIRSLKLQGNHLGNKGIHQLLRALALNESLEKINIADTGLNLLDFKALNKPIAESKEQFEDCYENPENEGTGTRRDSSIDNIKEVIHFQEHQESPEGYRTSMYPQFSHLQHRHPSQKFIKTLNPNDDTQTANIMRLLTAIMKNNLILSKYDLKFNPISNDAATLLFEVICENIRIKDVEFNNNVDNELRETMDTLMRRRTGRVPKAGRGTLKKHKKKKR